MSDPSNVTGLAGWWKASSLVGRSDGDSMTGIDWSDSSGSGFTMTGQTRAPIYKTAILNGTPILRFSNSGGNQTMRSATGPDFSASGGYTLVFIGIPAAYVGANQAFWLAANGVQGSQAFVLEAGLPGWAAFAGGGLSLGPPVVYALPQVVIITYAPTAGSSGAGIDTVRINGQDVWKHTGSYTAWDNTQPWFIGGRGASDAFGFTGDIAEVIAYAAPITAEADCRIIENYANATYAIGSQSSRLSASAQVVFDGNSITLGFGCIGTGPFAGTTLYGYPEQAMRRLAAIGTPYRYWNNGLIGQTTGQMTSRGVAYIDVRLADGYAVNVLVANEMVNDISGPSNAAQAYANVVAYCTARKAAGWQKVGWVGAGSFGNSTIDAVRIAACALLKADFTVPTSNPLVYRPRAGVSYADFYVDVSNSPTMGQLGANALTGSGGMYSDATHPAAGGSAEIATAVAAALGSIVAPDPPTVIMRRNIVR